MKNTKTKISGTIGGASRVEHQQANNGDEEENFDDDHVPEDDEENNELEEEEQGEEGGNTDREDYDLLESSKSNSRSSKGGSGKNSVTTNNQKSRSRSYNNQEQQQQLECSKRRKLSLGTPTTITSSKVTPGAGGVPMNKFQLRFQHKISDLLKKVPLCDQDSRIIRSTLNFSNDSRHWTRDQEFQFRELAKCFRILWPYFWWRDPTANWDKVLDSFKALLSLQDVITEVEFSKFLDKISYSVSTSNTGSRKRVKDTSLQKQYDQIKNDYSMGIYNVLKSNGNHFTGGSCANLNLHYKKTPLFGPNVINGHHRTEIGGISMFGISGITEDGRLETNSGKTWLPSLLDKVIAFVLFGFDAIRSVHELFKNVQNEDMPDVTVTDELMSELDSCENFQHFTTVIIHEFDICVKWANVQKVTQKNQLLISTINNKSLMFYQEKNVVSSLIYDSEINILFLMYRNVSTGKLYINPSTEKNGRLRNLKSFLSTFRARPMAWIIMMCIQTIIKRSMLGKAANAVNLRSLIERFQPNSPGITEIEEYFSKNVDECFGTNVTKERQQDYLKAFQLIFNTMEMCAKGDAENTTSLVEEENIMDFEKKSYDEEQDDNDHESQIKKAEEEEKKAQLRDDFGLDQSDEQII